MLTAPQQHFMIVTEVIYKAKVNHEKKCFVFKSPLMYGLKNFPLASRMYGLINTAASLNLIYLKGCHAFA